MPGGQAIKLEIKIDHKRVARQLGAFVKQTPFALSYGMNLTAGDAVKTIRTDLHRFFTVRNAWTAKGVSFKPSTKRNLNVEIGSKDEYMVAQALGGRKKAKAGGDVAIPLVGRGKPRSSIRSKTPPSKWPKAVTGPSHGSFVGTIKTRKGPVRGVWRRIYRNKRSGKIAQKKTEQSRPGLFLLYQLKGDVKIDKRWPLKRQVETVWAARWPANIKKAMDYAVRTAKRK